MTISGFTIVRNATNYYFPIKESILSILPIVDEFIIALGNSDPGDTTREEIASIQSDKIKVIDRVWSQKDFIDGRILADETNFALQQCTGDWCFYLQADEVIHEKDLPVIQKACADHLEDKDIDGFLFNYHHFFGDYDHYLPFHGWYKNEIRVIRNHAGIYSIKDAQSFRRNNNEKLRVLPIAAHVYHYGWVRPPRLMQSKKKEHDRMHRGDEKINEEYKSRPNNFNYGPLGRLPLFKGSHPKVMDEFRTRLDWTNELNYSKEGELNRDPMKHERFKYRLLSFFENTFNGGKDFFGYSNWHIVKK